MGLRPNAPPGFQQTQPHQPVRVKMANNRPFYSAGRFGITLIEHGYGASSHLNSSVNNLSTIFNSCIYLSVLVGDGKLFCHNTGHRRAPTLPYTSLKLFHVSVEPSSFYGWTTIVAPTTWSSEVMLGKHVRLPFSLSETIVKAPFDIIHSGLWTSPLTSVSGIKYYVGYKARLVANGSSQLCRTLAGSPVGCQKMPFFMESLSETVYMHQPPGFRDPQHPDHVCLLQRSLYGLKQAPRAWFQRFAAYAARVGFHHSRCDSSLFIYRQGADTAYLLLYVDDIVLTASSSDLLQQIITSLHAEFSMTDLGSLNYFLGISVTRNASGMFLSQQKYATEVLDRAGMLNCKPCRTPVDTDSKLSADGAPISDSTLYRSLCGASTVIHLLPT
ncbi:ribonuclease H-like domain-containing protein [Tanacetum coccineum]|uniref:Ribonuclease H-like domain-containing protein n=1 Tax=Tanacetum coccineum TaxID=301880 RepID=A0ABQ5FQZ2_9ASTR